MSRFSKLVAKVIGIEEQDPYETNFDRLVGERWELCDYWNGLRLYHKDGRMVIYNHEDDSIVKQFSVKDYQDGKINES
jgi:hypothetical protein